MTDVDSNKLEHVALNDEGAIVTPDLVKKIQKEKANNNFMYVSTAMNFFLSWLMGSTMSMSAQAREFFQQANTTTLPQPMSNEDSEYFLSLPFFFVPIGFAISAFLASAPFFGPRRVLQLGAFLLIASYAMMILGSDSILVIHASRALCGLADGVTLNTICNYAKAISTIEFRGVAIAVIVAGLNISWVTTVLLITFIGLFPALITFCCLIFIYLLLSPFLVVESPAFLVQNRKTAEAARQIKRLRGRDYPARIEVKELQHSADADANNQTRFGLGKSVLALLTQRRILMPLFWNSVIMLIQVLSGADVLCYYIFDFCEYFGVDKETAKNVAIAFNISFGLSFILGSLCLVEKCNRKTLFVAFGLTQAAICAVLGILLILKSQQIITAVSVAILLALLVTMAVCFSFGVGPVGYAIIMELAPVDAVGICTALPHALRYVALFLLNKVFFSIIGLIGPAGYLFFFAAVGIIGQTCFLIFVPETRGLSVSELATVFEKRINSHVDA